MAVNKKRLLTGAQASGKLHLGNYFGALKQFLELQFDYDARVFIADYHSLTTVYNPDDLKLFSQEVTLDYLSIGLDPEHIRLYRQSDVPAHCELQTILNNVVPVSYLMRAHAFKDAEAKGVEINAGTFNYPILMAADIIIYDTEVVLVGSDQKQHVEYARDFAGKFNQRYEDTFTLPEPLILEDVGLIPGLDGRKMSKSYRNHIPISATDEEVFEAIMSIPTDSQPIDQPKENYLDDTLYQLHTFFTTGSDLGKVKEGYLKGGLGYRESKEILIKNILEILEPIRVRRQELEQKPDLVASVLDDGAKRSRLEAEAKLEEVRRRVGLSI